MHARLIRRFDFQAAHSVPTFPEGHRCRGLHGHTYYVDVILEGEVDPAKGYLVDFGEVKAVVKPVIDELDHQHLNDLPGLEVPTAEMIAKWVYDRLQPKLPMLASIRVQETANNTVEYDGR